MNHRVTDFNARRPSVDKNSARLAFQQRQEPSRQAFVFRFHMQRRRKLAFQRFENSRQLRLCPATHDKRRRPKNFLIQRLVGEIVFGGNDE